MPCFAFSTEAASEAFTSGTTTAEKQGVEWIMDKKSTIEARSTLNGFMECIYV
jgi:hypothetical protein